MKIFPPVLASDSHIPNTEQCERLALEMEILMEGFEWEQLMRLSSEVPSVKEFWECRLISSGVGTCVAVNE